jgi:hypothetical protein
MKKVFSLMMLLAGVFVFGAVDAQAALVVSIDGTEGAGEWSNAGYPYYLEVTDPNEFDANPALNIPDAYDIKRMVLFQELDGFGGDGDASNDGIYLLIETYAKPSLVDLTPGGAKARIFLDGDFHILPDAPGPTNVFDFSLEHTADAGGGSQSVEVTFNVFGPTGSILPEGAFSTPDGVTDTVIEYFIPSGKFGTPAVPFPADFIGLATYDNGAVNPDDIAVGSATLVPEPSSMLLFGGALLGLVARKRFAK